MDDRLKKAIKKVKIIITDMDGVMTDGTVYMGNDGVELKRFSVLDGAGVAMVKTARIRLAIISGRFSPATISRAQELKLAEDCYQGNINKLSAYDTLKSKYAFSDEEAAFIGDDIIDLNLMEKVGLPIAVNNAHPLVKSVAKLVTERSGGEGAFREAVEVILKGKEIFEEVVAELRERMSNG